MIARELTGVRHLECRDSRSRSGARDSSKHFARGQTTTAPCCAMNSLSCGRPMPWHFSHLAAVWHTEQFAVLPMPWVLRHSLPCVMAKAPVATRASAILLDVAGVALGGRLGDVALEARLHVVGANPLRDAIVRDSGVAVHALRCLLRTTRDRCGYRWR